MDFSDSKIKISSSIRTKKSQTSVLKRFEEGGKKGKGNGEGKSTQTSKKKKKPTSGIFIPLTPSRHGGHVMGWLCSPPHSLFSSNSSLCGPVQVSGWSRFHPLTTPRLGTVPYDFPEADYTFINCPMNKKMKNENKTNQTSHTFSQAQRAICFPAVTLTTGHAFVIHFYTFTCDPKERPSSMICVHLNT